MRVYVQRMRNRVKGYIYFCKMQINRTKTIWSCLKCTETSFLMQVHRSDVTVISYFFCNFPFRLIGLYASLPELFGLAKQGSKSLMKVSQAGDNEFCLLHTKLGLAGLLSYLGWNIVGQHTVSRPFKEIQCSIYWKWVWRIIGGSFEVQFPAKYWV